MSTAERGFRSLVLVLLTTSLAVGAYANEPSGLVQAPGWELVQSQCSACHSIQLVTNHRLSREKWLKTIRWMQEQQNLWPLGDLETPILDYLAKNYGPVKDQPMRRRPLPIHRQTALE